MCVCLYTIYINIYTFSWAQFAHLELFWQLEMKLSRYSQQKLTVFWVCLPASSPTTGATWPGGGRFTAPLLSSPECPGHAAANLATHRIWWSSNCGLKWTGTKWPSLCLNMVFVMDNPGRAQKSTAQVQISRPFFPTTPLQWLWPLAESWTVKQQPLTLKQQCMCDVKLHLEQLMIHIKVKQQHNVRIHYRAWPSWLLCCLGPLCSMSLRAERQKEGGDALSSKWGEDFN